MRTDRLVQLLATGTEPVEANGVARRHAAALLLGSLVALLLMVGTLGVRSDVGDAVHLPMFWVKLMFPALVAVGGVVAASRLSRPGAPLGRVPAAIAIPVLAIWAMGGLSLWSAGAQERADAIFGPTWILCPPSIALVSMPVLVATFWAMKGLAPTRPALAGAASGLLAGAVGATVYALHCTEMAALFLGIWYLAGMLMPAAAGALLGPRLLRW